ncbi:helix-turn-helix domain-containing protein [Amycolatopsis sp. OK19-0408]|uniref:Helix-turn-helix domain-containing protein n=1 Tax=Amycolatopsis iheyensis TaxID=2945988 RepID=A0A9X2SK06_9PSEU|nr:helix-turn-helix domain-containing protein [Amycolatopsis iheyensis]MCR6484974.1 helix-turn-helix domain-containing protein [Amycolatopsis iheyensis]
MPPAVDRHAFAELATTTVPAREAFAYWRELISATFVPLTAERVADRGFRGRIRHAPVGDLELSTVLADGQHVRRTPSLIGRSADEYLLASIQLRGRGRVEQDGRVALLAGGDMAFYDSTRPYTLHFDGPFQQLVVQVPKARLPVRDTRELTARALAGAGPAAPVPAFLTSLARTVGPGGDEALLLVPHALGLLTAAAALAGRAAPAEDAATALARERVERYLREHADDPRLDAERVAAACAMSRRTLYRVLGEDGVAARLRRIRLERARAMLVAAPHRPIAAVAAACGFESDSGFHRAFRAAAGCTPGEYRRRHRPGTRGR